jgi:tRNA(fMet)-specific endonuclease VapC
VNYLLDTNACLALINGAPESVRTRFRTAVESGATIGVPTIVAFELWCGLAKSSRQEFNAHRVATFFDGPVQLTPFEDDDARTAGRLRAALDLAGAPIRPFDVLIAGQALGRGATLVTANAGEFKRVAGLKWEDWASSKG